MPGWWRARFSARAARCWSTLTDIGPPSRLPRTLRAVPPTRVPPMRVPLTPPAPMPDGTGPRARAGAHPGRCSIQELSLPARAGVVFGCCRGGSEYYPDVRLRGRVALVFGKMDTVMVLASELETSSAHRFLIEGSDDRELAGAPAYGVLLFSVQEVSVGRASNYAGWQPKPRIVRVFLFGQRPSINADKSGVFSSRFRAWRSHLDPSILRAF
jgi:hypothetical protein